MSDHADTIRDVRQLVRYAKDGRHYWPDRKEAEECIVALVPDLLAALDALVDQRDEAQRLYELFRERYESKYTEWNASKTNAVKAAALGKWAVAIISNVSEGDLTQQAQEWQDAAHKWLDEFHAPARAALAEDA